jgi:hypothetical protein
MDAPPATLISQSIAQPSAVHIPQAIAAGRRGSADLADLTLREVRREVVQQGIQSIRMVTNAGTILAKYHPVEGSVGRSRAVVWVGGARGGLDGPAAGLYPAACAELQRAGVAGLRIHYREPNDLAPCILDTMLAVAFLRAEGMEGIGLVGHSFGGAVVISAGAFSPEVTAVVPISTQTYGTDLAPEVSPRPMLIVHGTADEILPAVCSERVYAAAREPKELKLFRGAGHGLDSVRDEVLLLLVTWLQRNT